MRGALASLSASLPFLGFGRWRHCLLVRAASLPMTLSQADIRAIVRRASDPGDSSVRPRWAVEMRRMLSALADLEFRPGRASPLVKLCEAGASYGWQSLESAGNPDFLSAMSRKAKASLTRDLRRNLEQLTRPCLELERSSFSLALNSIGTLPGRADPKLVDHMFLGDRPSHRLFALFKAFPLLARLWSQLISQWRNHVTEVVSRFAVDGRALSRLFFGGQPLGTIVDIRCNLSDSHNQGRTVVELQSEAGAVIYKPRPGDGEWEWGALLEWMNARFFRPRLRTAQVLRRKGYCWMERIEAAPCQSRAAARRFYERLGGFIAAAYLLQAVDCHRDNLIASGEDPVLVDVDALWHVSPGTRTQTPLDLLFRIGFFPNSNRRSLQSRSSVLGWSDTGKHIVRLGAEPLDAGQYQREIVKGFRRAWHCILGRPDRRQAFARRLRRIQSRKRRWFYWPTEKYAAIKRASIQPAALRFGIERNLFIARLCQRDSMTATLIQAEVDALKNLDIPYFVRTTQERFPSDAGLVCAPVLKALSRAPRWRCEADFNRSKQRERRCKSSSVNSVISR